MFVKQPKADIHENKRLEAEASSSKTKAMKGIKQAVKEVNLVKSGKLKARKARHLTNEL